jgi:hypothetical protein
MTEKFYQTYLKGNEPCVYALRFFISFAGFKIVLSAGYIMVPFSLWDVTWHRLVVTDVLV